MILLVDNYDSFTYNLSDLIRSRLPTPRDLVIVRNDAGEARALLASATWTHLVLSPGPGHPRDARLSVELPPLVPSLPVLGVCLGHQILAVLEGAVVTRTPHAAHGSTTRIEHDGRGLFSGIQGPFDAALYHSLAVDDSSVPHTLDVSARSEAGAIMAIRHRSRPHAGVQFHPESFMTPLGAHMIDNFLALGPLAS